MRFLEQTLEIGILSAVGWSIGRIMKMIVLEGLILALGVGGLYWLIGFTLVKDMIEFELSARLLMEVMSGAIILGGLGSLHPAWRAVRLNVADALRYE